MAYQPRTDKPKYLRPNSFRGNAFEIVDTTSGSGLRDINGETPPHNILTAAASIGVSRCSNSEAMQAALLRESFAYYTASKPVAATYESGTMWIAFKLLAKSGGWHEWMGSIDAARQFFVSSGADNVQFKVNGSFNIAPVGGNFEAIGSLNVIGYSWGSEGYKGYINGKLVVSDSTLPTGNGNLTGLSIGTWTGGTPYMDRADYYSVRVLPRALSDAEHKAWAEDIWTPYRVTNTRKIFIPNVAAGGITGSGTLLSSNATISGVGIRKVTGLGVLQSGSAAITGVGLRKIISTGALLSASATISGIGLRKIIGSGTLQSGNAFITGVGSVGGVVVGSGTLLSSNATISGIGIRKVTGLGVLQSGSASITGIGLRKVISTGVLISANATISGVGIRKIIGIGALISANATISGNNNVLLPSYEVINMLLAEKSVLSMSLSDTPTAAH